MSQNHDDSLVYCPFDSTELKVDPNFLFPRHQLYFCPFCQLHRAPYQTYFKIESRFCSSCLTEFRKESKRYTCSKNCFICPECASDMKITVRDHDKGAKSFKFRCTECPYIFQTSIFCLPKPLRDIIESDKNDSFSRLCNDIKNGVLKGQTENRVSDQTRKNLELMNKATRQETRMSEVKKYPLPRRLTMRKSIYCVKCNTMVSTPI